MIYRKSVLPGDELIDRANAAKKLYILIAHHIDRLRPQNDARDQHYNQNYPAYSFHSTLRLMT